MAFFKSLFSFCHTNRVNFTKVGDKVDKKKKRQNPANQQVSNKRFGRP